MELGNTLAQLRKQKKLSQRNFAEAIGVSNGAVAMWETNKRQPDLEMLKKIAAFYDVSSDYILGITQADSHKHSNLDCIINKPENPPADYLVAISQQKQFLSKNESLLQSITDREYNLIEIFRQLNNDNQDIIIGEFKKLLKEQRNEEAFSAEKSLKIAK